MEFKTSKQLVGHIQIHNEADPEYENSVVAQRQKRLHEISGGFIPKTNNER